MGEIIGVVFSGFVAALVVYVGAYGGIAVVSTVEGDPDPYVIFFICLGAAVFSEKVWAQARDRLFE